MKKVLVLFALVVFAGSVSIAQTTKKEEATKKVERVATDSKDATKKSCEKSCEKSCTKGEASRTADGVKSKDGAKTECSKTAEKSCCKDASRTADGVKATDAKGECTKSKSECAKSCSKEGAKDKKPAAPAIGTQEKRSK